MTGKFKALVCAITAAVVSTGAVASAAVSEAPSAEESAFEAALEQRSDPEWCAAFEEALLEGKSPMDPLYAAYKGVTDDSDAIMPVYLEQMASPSVNVGLTLVHDSGESGYNLWSGRFIVDDVSKFSASFSEPKSMKCMVDIDSGTLTSKSGFESNYKSVIATFTYLVNGKQVGKTKSDSGCYPVREAKPDSSSGKLIDKAYYFYMYAGNINAPYYDVVVIHVVDKNYAETEEYAALPYANLIGCYTYVDVNNLPAVDFEEN